MSRIAEHARRIERELGRPNRVVWRMLQRRKRRVMGRHPGMDAEPSPPDPLPLGTARPRRLANGREGSMPINPYVRGR